MDYLKKYIKYKKKYLYIKNINQHGGVYTLEFINNELSAIHQLYQNVELEHPLPIYVIKFDSLKIVLYKSVFLFAYYIILKTKNENYIFSKDLYKTKGRITNLVNNPYVGNKIFNGSVFAVTKYLLENSDVLNIIDTYINRENPIRVYDESFFAKNIDELLNSIFESSILDSDTCSSISDVIDCSALNKSSLASLFEYLLVHYKDIQIKF